MYKTKSTFKEIAIEAYKIHYTKHKGITRDDLVKGLKHSEKYAKKLLYECQSNNLLMSLKGHKQGRFKEYFLSTELNKFIEAQERNQKSIQLADGSELSVIQMLVNEITQRKPTFHKLLIHFNTLQLEKDVEFYEIYQSLSKEDNWIVKSQKNKAKVKSFRIESKRNFTVQVYPIGKVVVMIESSYRPYKLHEEDGSQQFFTYIGKIEQTLSQELGQTSILPPSSQWLLKGYDRDVTIPESELLEKYPTITHWYIKEGIQLRALGRVFQMFGKIMPICGKCLRFEDKVGIKEDIPLEQGIEQAIEQPLEITTAFEMLNNHKMNKAS